jgi:hypothetical protein
MINTYKEAIDCINNVRNQHDTLVDTINSLYNSNVSNANNSRHIKREDVIIIRDALKYANIQNNDMKTYFNRFKALVEADVPKIGDYGNAKTFFEKKKLYRTQLFSGIACYAAGVASLAYGNIALACTGIAMSATSFRLSSKNMPREDDETYSNDLKRYKRAIDKYEAGMSFHTGSMNDFKEALGSYIFAIGMLIDKLAPTHSKNGVPDDALNTMVNAYIEMGLFRENAPHVVDAIIKHKGVEDKKQFPKIRRMIRRNIESKIET